MAEPVLWSRELHTAAKHRVLRAYLDAWIPIMAQQAIRVRDHMAGKPRLLLVDGFAGPGTYATGEDGSPLIMLQALLRHSAFPRLNEVAFNFLFIEQDKRRYDELEHQIDALGDLPPNVRVFRRHGAFETVFSDLIERPRPAGAHLVPTFAFIDPFGYAHASMALTGRLLNFPRCETLFFLPLTYVHRFVGREGQDEALNSLFGCDEWRGAIALSGNARKQFLLDLFERQIGQNANVESVRSFQLKTQDGMDYRLVFALGHRKGLEVAKDAMWKVDPIGGTSYTAETDTGQEVLFGADATLDTGPLLADLRQHFGSDWFTVREAEDRTLFGTPYRIAHLKTKTLKSARKEGLLEFDPSDAAAFTRVRRMRFSK